MSLSELGCPSLDYVYKMTWAEYRIRLHGWKVRQKRMDYRQRDVMYQILLSGWADPKKKPPSIDAYWDISGNQNDSKLHSLEALKRAKEEYNKSKNSK